MISSLHLWRLRFFALLLSFLFTLLVTISIPSVQLPVVRVTLSNDGTSVNEMRFGAWSYCLHRRDFDNDPCDTFSPCTNEDRRRICSSPTSVSTFATLATLFTRRPSIWTSRLSLLVSFTALIVSILFCTLIENGLEKFDEVLNPNVEFGAGTELLIVSFALNIIEERARWYVRRKEARSTVLPLALLGDASDRLALSSAERPSESSTLTLPPRVYFASHFAAKSFECTICMEDGLKDFTILPCGHGFCTKCTEKSLKLYKRCPLCNAETC
ncbi:hypothetical protein SCHPADRAFT_968010 [Schizopora paradoxa]|uniref:RING-type domain-containing protein n=1 Tax=Schizopora paradoxa TaxID=27342 RepID=A0A0H2RPH0_9AGAM|nr:hypothetical protein SCHPADRAFT_968010 [Schizopora paradoxa]